ncbi:MAG: hypothetical protein Q7W30_08835 [Coriobacteriia bacterium]|nr:hypothetical protein [Coriobacteriia bacterium]
MKIAHFQVPDAGSGSKTASLARMVEKLKGVAGVAIIRSMGLLTVLYDERRVDPLSISTRIVQAESTADPAAEEPAPPSLSSGRGRAKAPKRRVNALRVRGRRLVRQAPRFGIE